MNAIDTPCRKICAVDPAARACVACGRTLEEIGSWLSYNPEKRQRIMRELPARLLAARLRVEAQTNACPSKTG